jgi:catechol 2,3-dioxygenase-like lactoylglutathione lyase family enzyme
MARPAINGITPFFIVDNVPAAVAFYCDKLGFDVIYQEPEDDPFFAIVCRDGAMLMVKAVEVKPLPNPARDPAARWDAYLSVPDPDALAAEFASRGVIFSEPLKDTTDGLRGFEVKDADGYVLFFGRPREDSTEKPLGAVDSD